MGLFQEQNRQEIRHAVGYNLNDVIISEATAAGAASTLIDTYALARGGTDEYTGRQVMVYSPAGSIVSGEKTFVSDFLASSAKCTVVPTFSAASADGDKYEMWRTFLIEEVNDAINQAIIDVSSEALLPRQTDSNFTLSGEYEYDWLTSYSFGDDFKGLHKVEYVSTCTYHDIDMCEEAWTALAGGNVTVALDTIYNVEGTYCEKITIADGAAANDKVATHVITSVDLSDCDKVEITIRSTVALSAGDLHLLLDDTAACATPLETIDIPATTINTTTTHSIDLANPHLDTTIISVGIEMEVDKGAFILYVDRIKVVKSSTKLYKQLNQDHWAIVKGSSPKFRFTYEGLSIVGSNTQIRLTGYCCPDLLSDDTTDSEIDPSYLIARTTGRLLIGHAKSARLDIKDRANLSKYWLMEAQLKLPGMRTNYLPNTRWV